MADIARRDFSEIRDEVLARIAQTDAAAAFKTRIEYLVWAAYNSLALTFHQYELHKYDQSLVLSTAANTLTLPTDCYIPIAMRLKTPASTVAGFVTESHNRSVFNAWSDNTTTHPKALPTSYARRNRTLFFDTTPDLAYEVDLLYYARPARVDFTITDQSELEEVWDQYIIEYTLALAFPALYRFDMGQMEHETLREWLSRNTDPKMAMAGVAEIRERPLSTVRMGGDR